MEKNVIREVKKEHKGREYSFPLGVKAENVETNDNRQFISKEELAELKKKPSPTSPINNNTVEFLQATARVNLVSGEKTSILFGKIMKWLADLGTAAFNGVSNSLGVTSAGYVLDARAGKEINDKLGGMKFYEDATGKYVIGADSVPKKLGSPDIITQTDNSAYKYEGTDYDIVETAEKKQWKTRKNLVFDIKSLYTNYASLTVDNFYFCITESKVEHYITAGCNIGDPTPFTMEKEYNSVSGQLTIKNVSGGSYESSNDPGRIAFEITGFKLLIL